MTRSTNRLITLEEILESKIHKEKELAYYEEKLKEITEKMYWLKRDLDLTHTIIEMIQTESVPKLGK